MRKQPAVRVVAVGQLQPHRALALEGPRPVLQQASGTLVLFGASGFRCLTDLVLIEECVVEQRRDPRALRMPHGRLTRHVGGPSVSVRVEICAAASCQSSLFFAPFLSV